jgi:hypothetical protein
MVCKIAGYSRKINVGSRKIPAITPQKPTVQKHNLLRYEKKWPLGIDPCGHHLWINELPEYLYQ